MYLKEWFNELANYIIPPTCVVCGRELLRYEKHMCLECFAGLPMTYFWKYQDNSAEISFWGKVRIERVYSLFFYRGSYKKLLYSIKYKSNIRLCKYLGKAIGSKIAESLIISNDKIDYIIPVPLHFLKKWKRGFNQSEIIAKEICKELNNATQKTQVINLLKRVRFTKTQTHKNKMERWKSVEHAFTTKNNLKKYTNSINNKHILIIDDVLTTGATIESCANAILKKYNCRISIATLAYVE